MIGGLLAIREIVQVFRKTFLGLLPGILPVCKAVDENRVGSDQADLSENDAHTESFDTFSKPECKVDTQGDPDYEVACESYPGCFFLKVEASDNTLSLELDRFEHIGQEYNWQSLQDNR